MPKPTLIVMAAGMGSRFGGLKQMTPVDKEGHFIIDFSLFDAYRAGFRRVVFLIKREMEQDFRSTIGDRISPFMEVVYAFQDLDNLPEGFTVPADRKKPWGTGHAVACCKDVIDGPFAAINADDFYGPSAYQVLYRFLTENPDGNQYALVSYLVRNTVTENGSVARGVCEVENGLLTGITERTKIFKKGEDAEFQNEDGSRTFLRGDTNVSMNCWGFTAKFMNRLWEGFPGFLKENLPVNPEKCEYFLPSVVNSQLEDGTATVRVLPCEETWYGVTYKEDLPLVCEAVQKMKDAGIYPVYLWGENNR